MSILLTGFGAFPGVTSNPTEEIARSFSGSLISGQKIISIVLPVSFKRSVQICSDVISSESPSLVVQLGVSSRIDHVHLEERAVNRRWANISDVDGEPSPDLPLLEGSDPEIRTSVELEKLQDALIREGFESKISDDAGTYVCNALYHFTLREQKESDTPVLFVHVPQPGVSRPEGGKWSLTELISAIRIILTQLV